MTPQNCLETRLKLGWTREELAAAASLAVPIVRLYEAGALEGFDDCREAITAALAEGQDGRIVRPSRFATKARTSRRGGLAEKAPRWRAFEGGTMVAAG
jgi:hypothetical protein